MKNFKRFLAVVLAVMFVVTTAAVSVSAGADESAWYIKAVRYLDNLTISDIGAKGDEPVSRDEFVTWVSKIESHQLVEEAWNVHRYVTAATSVFTDVEDSDHKGAIGYAVNRGFIEGYGDKTFGPHNTVKLGEASAIIVRMMGYQDFVEEGDEWAYNNMYVANSFCHAFDETFLNETGTYDPDYELTKGEAAWLLYTIMNGDYYRYNVAYDDIKNPEALTSKDINLGAWFGDTKTFNYDVIVTYVPYKLTATAGVSYRRYDAIVAGGFNYNKVDSLPRTNGWLDTTKNVTLTVVGSSTKFYVKGADFAKLLGVTDATANVLETAEVGSMLRLSGKAAISAGTVLDKNSKVTFKAIDKLASDSYIGAASVSTKDVLAGNTTVGWKTLTSAKTASAAYTRLTDKTLAWDGNKLVVDGNAYTLVTKYTGAANELKVFAPGVTAAKWIVSVVGQKGDTLYKGGLLDAANYEKVEEAAMKADMTALEKEAWLKETFKAGVTKTDLSGTYTELLTDVELLKDVNTFVAYNVKTAAGNYVTNTTFNLASVFANGGFTTEVNASATAILDAKAAKQLILSPAQGECNVVFSDTDGDGLYDVAVITESTRALYYGTINASVNPGSNGQVGAPESYTREIYDSFGNYVTAAQGLKGHNVGGLVVDKTVGYGGTTGGGTDGWNLSNTATNKVQLVVCSSNERQIYGGTNDTNDYGPSNIFPYTTVDVAELKQGYIQSVASKKATIDGAEYYVATVVTTDNATTLVYIPVAPESTITLPVTLDGVTCNVTFQAGKSLLSFVTDHKADDEIAVTAGQDGAWMAGHTVKYVADENGIAWCMVDTAVSSAVTGYVVGVEKSEAGDNTYKVEIVATGAPAVESTKFDAGKDLKELAKTSFMPSSSVLILTAYGIDALIGDTEKTITVYQVQADLYDAFASDTDLKEKTVTANSSAKTLARYQLSLATQKSIAQLATGSDITTTASDLYNGLISRGFAPADFVTFKSVDGKTLNGKWATDTNYYVKDASGTDLTVGSTNYKLVKPAFAASVAEATPIATQTYFVSTYTTKSGADFKAYAFPQYTSKVDDMSGIWFEYDAANKVYVSVGEAEGALTLAGIASPDPSKTYYKVTEKAKLTEGKAWPAGTTAATWFVATGSNYYAATETDWPDANKTYYKLEAVEGKTMVKLAWPEGTANTAWYELSKGVYTRTSDITPDPTKTYYFVEETFATNTNTASMTSWSQIKTNAIASDFYLATGTSYQPIDKNAKVASYSNVSITEIKATATKGSDMIALVLPATETNYKWYTLKNGVYTEFAGTPATGTTYYYGKLKAAATFTDWKNVPTKTNYYTATGTTLVPATKTNFTSATELFAFDKIAEYKGSALVETSWQQWDNSTAEFWKVATLDKDNKLTAVATHSDAVPSAIKTYAVETFDVSYVLKYYSISNALEGVSGNAPVTGLYGNKIIEVVNNGTPNGNIATVTNLADVIYLTTDGGNNYYGHDYFPAGTVISDVDYNLYVKAKFATTTCFMPVTVKAKDLFGFMYTGNELIIDTYDGKSMMYAKDVESYSGNKLQTLSVKASATAVWTYDAATYALIEKVLTKGAVSTADAKTTGRVNGSDLIYLSFSKDAGSYYTIEGKDAASYLDGGDKAKTGVAYGETGLQRTRTDKQPSLAHILGDYSVFNRYQSCPYVYFTYPVYTVGAGSANMWTAGGEDDASKTKFENAYILSIVESTKDADKHVLYKDGQVPTADKIAKDGARPAEEIGYWVKTTVTVGVNPYYYRTEKGIVLKWAEVNVYDNVRTYYTYGNGATDGVAYELFTFDKNGIKTNVVDTDGTYAKDPVHYFVDPTTKFVYQVVDGTTSTYNKDVVTKTICWLNGEKANNPSLYNKGTETDKYPHFNEKNDSKTKKDEEFKLASYSDISTLSVKAYTMADDGDKFVPGLYHVYMTNNTLNNEFNGVREFAMGANDTIVVLTPDAANGFKITKVTPAILEANDATLFITDYQYKGTAAASTTLLSVIGEVLSEEEITPVDPPVEPEKQFGDDGEKLVYLTSDIDVEAEAIEAGQYWIIKSSGDAIDAITGEVYGPIQYKYNTYKDAQTAASKVSFANGGYFIVDKDGNVIASLDEATAGVYGGLEVVAGKVTSATATKVVGTLGSKTGVDFSTVDFKFIYHGIDGEYFGIGGDSTKVSVASTATIKGSFAAYEAIIADVASTADEVAAAKQAIADAKAAAETTYFNGQFWGSNYSPAYNYILSQSISYQATGVTISFNYVVIGGTTYVFVNTFN